MRRLYFFKAKPYLFVSQMLQNDHDKELKNDKRRMILMRVSSIKWQDREVAAIIHQNKYYLIDEINKTFNKKWSKDLFSLITNEELLRIRDWYNQEGVNTLHN